MTQQIINDYPFVTVWKKNGFGVGKGIIVENGYSCKITSSLGFLENVILPSADYYHSEQFIAKVKSVDDRNLTGMFHLYEEWSDNADENAQSLKLGLVGTELIVEAAHWSGDRRIYRSVYPEHEYWSDLEIEIIEKIR
jgi:hypothetical protein